MYTTTTRKLVIMAAVALAGTLALNAAAQQAQPAAQPAADIPRGLDGKPDFTGVWANYAAPGGRGGGIGGGGRGRGGGAASTLTPLAQEKVAAYRAVTANTNHSPGAYCVGSGMPASMSGSGGYPMEILQNPTQINVTYEAHKEIRRIYIGDHGYDPATIFHERNGFSVGRWEGDTLVVEVTHLVEQFDSSAPHSDQARIVERYTLGVENGRRVLTNEWTMTDPVYLTEPMTGTKRWSELVGGRLLNYECTEPEWDDIVQRLLAGEDIGYQGE